MVVEKPSGAPRIHGELRMLGFDFWVRTLSLDETSAEKSYRAKRGWSSFETSEAIAVMDFTVPTITFGALLLLVISHDRRRILHFNVTKHPTSADHPAAGGPFEASHKYLICDRDQVRVRGDRSGGHTDHSKRTSFRSSCQNGIAERCGSCRRDLLTTWLRRTNAI